MSGQTLKLKRDFYPWEKEILSRAELYLVGGCVRDLLLGASEASIDEDYLVRRIGIDELISVLNMYGKTSLVGKSFGVIKFRARNMPDKLFDISMPRKEQSTGVHHRDFEVHFDPSLPVEVDLERRDFTINSMALELSSGRLIDPLGGYEDLKKRVLRVNREKSFVEDALRILRGVQFQARFNLTVEDETFELMKKYSDLILSISPERIRDELTKLLVEAEKPSKGFILMHEAGILALIIPELDITYGVTQNEYHPDDVFMHSLKTCDEIEPRLNLRWSALLHDIGKERMKKVVDGRVVFYGHQDESARAAEAIMKRLRYPLKLVERVKTLIIHHMFNIDENSSDAAVGRFLRKIGKENLYDMLSLRRADLASRGDLDADERVARLRERIESYIEKQNAFSVKDLEIDGKDVMRELGLSQGPEVGRVLRQIFEKVSEDPSLNKREKLLEILRGFKAE